MMTPTRLKRSGPNIDTNAPCICVPSAGIWERDTIASEKPPCPERTTATTATMPMSMTMQKNTTTRKKRSTTSMSGSL